jgi:hypothetical protein
MPTPPATSTPIPPECRPHCGACCIAPSISSPIPGMPHGKPAGVRCIQLDEHNRCRIFGRPERPPVCGSLRPEPEMCGTDAHSALLFLQRLEKATSAAVMSSEGQRSDRAAAYSRRP